jgi:ionotropic glutamate receptor
VIEGSGRYAFFMESLSIEYQTERHCQLVQVGPNLDTKSYGIALPERSSLRPLVSTAIIKLKETGVIAALKRKWWQEERGGGACAGRNEAASTAASMLTLRNLGGIFVVLGLGLALGLGLVGLELLWMRWKTNNKLI